MHWDANSYTRALSNQKREFDAERNVKSAEPEGNWSVRWDDTCVLKFVFSLVPLQLLWKENDRMRKYILKEKWGTGTNIQIQ